jgi:AraC-like DNA-binding protein
LTRRLKADERTSHIPMILLTARAEIESRRQGLQTGADDYLAKPFDLEELRIRVANLIEQRRRLAKRSAQRVAWLAPEAMPVVSADEKFLARARKVIEEHLDDEHLDVQTLCREIGLSRAQLHRKLKALTGFSTREFVRTHRLRRAATLLEGGYGNVTEVAFAVGFSSSSYFAQCFREQYGVSPSEFRAKGRAREAAE